MKSNLMTLLPAVIILLGILPSSTLGRAQGQTSNDSKMDSTVYSDSKTDGIYIPLLEMKDSIINDIVKLSLSIYENDSIQGECLTLLIKKNNCLIEQKNDSIITRQLLTCTAIMDDVLNIPIYHNDISGYCKINNCMIIVCGEESSIYFRKNKSELIDLNALKFPNLHEYTYPTFLIIDQTPYLELPTTSLRKIYGNAVSLVLSDNKMERRQVKIEKELLPYDSINIEFDDPNPIKMISCQQLLHAYNNFIINSKLFENRSDNCDSRIIISEVKNGFFIIKFKNIDFEKNYYFFIDRDRSSVKLLKHDH